ncbi:MAG: hypothetical protein HQM08_14275 [Candidatus Riflebacteria bacterium]|nr:hypothetical protein [Candidatus Riflebacteria bacterium]
MKTVIKGGLLFFLIIGVLTGYAAPSIPSEDEEVTKPAQQPQTKQAESRAIPPAHSEQSGPLLALALPPGEGDGDSGASSEPVPQRVRDAARDFYLNSVSTAMGPGGGRVACAWVVSKILRQAGAVPRNWNENNAPQLSNKLMKRGWKKVPFNPNLPVASQLKAGDVILWSPDHVGVYDQNGYCFSNSSSKKVVKRHPVVGYGPWKKVVRVVRAP